MKQTALWRHSRSHTTIRFTQALPEQGHVATKGHDSHGTLRAVSARQFLVILASAALCTNAIGAEADADARCADRLDATKAAAIGGPRLPDLRYECVVLDNGRALLVGDSGGTAHNTVLLVHGLGDYAHRDWRTVVPQLVQGFRVIAIDLPGFGASETLPGVYTFQVLAGTLDEVLRRREIERVHVVGHSLGAALSLHFAWTHPQRVDRLVLVDVAGILQESVYLRHLTQFDALASSGNRLASALKKVVSALTLNFMRKVDGKLDITSWLVRNPKARESLFGDRPQFDAALNLIQQNFGPAIRDTQAPTTVIWGRDDPITPVRTGTLLAGRMRNAGLHVLDGVGHVPMTESAEPFNALLRSALSDPVVAKVPAVAATDSQGDVVCKSKSKVRYTGTFSSLRIINCSNALIEDATIGRLIVDQSSAELRNVNVNSEKVALVASGSYVTGTNVRLQGAIAIKADGSEIELAGASILARRKALNLSSSARLYLSVSDIQSPSYTGDAHGIWTSRTREQ